MPDFVKQRKCSVKHLQHISNKIRVNSLAVYLYLRSSDGRAICDICFPATK